MEITLTIPTDYSSITLKQWLNFMKDLKNYEGDEEAIFALMLHHLCGIDLNWINGMSITDLNTIRGELQAFLGNTELPLQQFVTIDNVEYGFEPNLSKMSYGAYLDIMKWDTITIDDNWAKIMDILYRPVDKKALGKYSLKPYVGEVNATKWMEVGMDVHFGALFFLSNLSMDLLNATLKSTKVEELHPSIKSILAKSGKDIPRLLNLQKGMLHELMQSLENL